MPFNGSMIADHHQDPPLRSMMGVIIRGKWIIAVTAAVLVYGAFIYVRVASPVYSATAKILVNPRFAQSNLFVNESGSWDHPSNIAENQLEILKSQSLGTEVAQKLYEQKYLDSLSMDPIIIIRPVLDSGYSPATLAHVRDVLSLSVDFELVPETDVITITAKSKDAREAALIANAFGAAYYDRNIRASRAKSRSFRDFLETQVAEKRRQLSEVENKLSAYMQEHHIVSLDEESKNLIEQISRLEAKRDETDLDIQSLSKTVTLYEGQVPAQESNLAKEIGEANDPYIRLLQEQLAKLEVQRDVTIAQNPSSVGKEIYGDNIKAIDDQINSLRAGLQKRTNDFIKTIVPGDKSGDGQRDPASYLKSVKEKIVTSKIELQALQARMEALNKTLLQYESQFAQIPVHNIEYARLERAKLSNEKLFLALQEKYNEAIITEQSEFGYVDIIDNASIPLKPASPKVMLVMLLGIVGGFGLGVAIVFLKERLDVKVHAPEELKSEGYAVVGTIFQVRDGKKGKKFRGLFALDKPFSVEAESFRHMRTNLRYLRPDQPLQTILITSSKPGEGKTTVVSNLAIAFAQSERRVVVVDTDLRKPALHGIFGLPSDPGLSDYLNDKASLSGVTQSTGISNLAFIGCGSRVANPAEMLGSARMGRFLEELKKQYDLILIDTSPVLAATDPSLLSALVEEVIVVASAGYTRLTEIRQAVELLEKVIRRTPVVVLNNFSVYRAYGIPYGHSTFGYYHDSYKKST